MSTGEALGEDKQTREADFTRVYDAHYSPVRAYAWRRAPDTADDVVAETFTIAWQRLERVPAEPPLADRHRPQRAP